MLLRLWAILPFGISFPSPASRIKDSALRVMTEELRSDPHSTPKRACERDGSGLGLATGSRMGCGEEGRERKAPWPFSP